MYVFMWPLCGYGGHFNPQCLAQAISRSLVVGLIATKPCILAMEGSANNLPQLGNLSGDQGNLDVDGNLIVCDSGGTQHREVGRDNREACNIGGSLSEKERQLYDRYTEVTEYFDLITQRLDSREENDKTRYEREKRRDKHYDDVCAWINICMSYGSANG